MSEGWLLSLVRRYPDPTALARRAASGSVFPALRGLEERGLVRRRRGRYRLTRRGEGELRMAHAIAGLLARTAPLR